MRRTTTLRPTTSTMRAGLLGVAVALTTASCHWGTRPKELRVANAAAGASVAVRLTGEGRDRVGELLAVDSAGLYLGAVPFVQPATAALPRLTFIVWPRIRAIDVDQLGGEFDLRAGQLADEALQQRLALVSRFRILTPELRQRVLRSYGQDTLDVVR